MQNVILTVSELRKVSQSFIRECCEMEFRRRGLFEWIEKQKEIIFPDEQCKADDSKEYWKECFERFAREGSFQTLSKSMVELLLEAGFTLKDAITHLPQKHKEWLRNPIWFAEITMCPLGRVFITPRAFLVISADKCNVVHFESGKEDYSGKCSARLTEQFLAETLFVAWNFGTPEKSSRAKEILVEWFTNVVAIKTTQYLKEFTHAPVVSMSGLALQPDWIVLRSEDTAAIAVYKKGEWGSQEKILYVNPTDHMFPKQIMCNTAESMRAKDVAKVIFKSSDQLELSSENQSYFELADDLRLEMKSVFFSWVNQFPEGGVRFEASKR
jgi:hypothetical protein